MANSTDPIEKGFLHSKRYILFWISSLLSNIGTWMQQVAQPWVVLTISNSSFWVGLDSFALNAPAWIFTLWGGVLADRWDRRRTVLFFQLIQFVCVIALIMLLALGWLKVWMIVCISFLVGTTDALSMPSFQSIIPSLVPAKEIPRAVSLNSTQFNLSRILGPMIAGLVMARYGAIASFSANAFSYIPFFLSLYWIHPQGRGVRFEMTASSPQASTKPHHYMEILRDREMRLALATILTTSLFCGPLITFSPVLIKEIFSGDVGAFGRAMASYGLGGLIGAALTLIPVQLSFKSDRLATGVAALMGLLVVFIATNRSFALLPILLVLAGIALTVSNVSANSFLQGRADNLVRGRVASLFQLALHGGISVGALVTGFTTSHFGVSAALLTNGGLAFALQLFVLRKQMAKC